MTARLYTLFVVLLSSLPLFGQNTVGTIAYNPDLYTEGYTMIYPHNQNRAMLLNACGEVVHNWTLDEDRRPGNTAYLQPNGDIIMTSRSASVGNDSIWAGGGGERIERRTWDNDVLWSFSANNDSMRLHHDFTVTPQGNVIAICWEVLDSLECIENGRNPDLLTGGEMWSDKLIELQPDGMGGADIVWEWRAWDHLVQDFDSTKANFGVVADNQSLIDINYGSISNQPADWLHMNAVDFWQYSDVDQIVMSVPTFNEVWVIWHGGFFDGDVIYRWGNPEAYDRGDSTNQRLFYQHDIHWGNGLGVNPGNPDFTKFFLFNNRVPNADTTGTHSEVATLSPIFDEYPALGGTVYEFDFDNGRWGPEDFEWTYTQPGLSSSGLSSFQRLGNGGNLICNGRTGELFEITEAGDLAWEYRTPLLAGAAVEQGTELQLNNNLTFRADRYPADFAAFDGQDLSSGTPIELNPQPLAVCAVSTCENPTACNYGEEGECEYISNDVPEGTLGAMMIGIVDSVLCPDGYEVTDDAFITLVPSSGGMEGGYVWDITPDIADLMIASGFESLYYDLLSQMVSVCGTEMTAVSSLLGDTLVTEYDGIGWPWPTYNGYTAPAVNFDSGCGDPDACNFDPCSLPDEALCTVMEVVSEVNDVILTVQVTGGTGPFTFNVLNGELEPIGFPSATEEDPTLVLVGLPDGIYCIEVSDSFGCTAMVCDTIGIVAVDVLKPLSFQMHPNPSSGFVQLTLPTSWDIQSISFRDAAGREVWTPGLRASGRLEVGRLTRGTYLVEVRHAHGVAVERLVIN